MILKNTSLEQLISKSLINNFDISNSEHLDQLSNYCIDTIKKNRGSLSNLPPFEKHPYIKALELTPPNCGMMIGTFPPISYLCDTLSLNKLQFDMQKITPPDLPYFHGNYGSLWEYSPINLQKVEKKDRFKQTEEIIKELNKRNIIYTDIIKYCQRKIIQNKYTSLDTALNNIVINDEIFDYLLKNNNINRLYFTNANIFSTNNYLFDRYGNYRLNYRDAFVLFLKGANDNNIKIQYKLSKNQSWVTINEKVDKETQKEANKVLLNKVYLKLRLSHNNNFKEYEICTPLSPAAVTRGRVRANKCVEKFRINNNLLANQGPEKFLIKALSCFFNNTLSELEIYNS